MKDSRIIKGDNYRFTIITNQLVRMEFSESGQFVDEKTIIVQNRDLGKPNFRVVENENKIEIITDFIHLYYLKNNPFNSETLYGDLKFNFSAYGNRWKYGDIPIENLKGTIRTLDNVDGAIKLEDGVLSKNGYVIIDDSQTFFVDGDKINEKTIVSEDIYLFAYGREYRKAISDFYKLSGSVPLLPKYALGNWWSRFWKYDEKEYLNLMDQFEERGIPLSVSVIDMDWHLTDIDTKYGSGWTGYTWNKELFPNPKKFMENLHQRGLTTSLNVHPADGIRGYEEAYPKVAEKLNLDLENEEPALFNLSNVSFKETYFKDVHHPLEEIGTDFWWLDWQQGVDGYGKLDPLWLLNIYHYNDIQRKGRNDIILSRYAGLGSHRYPIGFSGDSYITWDSLKFQPYLTATASNVGYSWWSHDIGGHMKGYRDEELALRWIQFGVFSPINRLHSSNSDFTGKEPWNYSLEIQKIMINYLRLRHQLIPYLFSMNVKNNLENTPLISPMYYDYPNEEESYRAKNQYFFGSELMVLPITSKTDSITKKANETIYLPKGIWFDYFSHKKYVGGSELEVSRGIENIPVFAKAGAIIPLDKSIKDLGNSDTLIDEIHWEIFPGENNEFELIEDSDSKRIITKIKLDINSKELKLFHQGDTSILPQKRKHVFHFVGSTPFIPKNKRNNEIRNYIYNEELLESQIEVDVEDTGLETIIDISGFEPVNKQNINKQLYELLNIAEIDFDDKQNMWNKLKNSSDFRKDITIIQKVKSEDLKKALLELIYVKYS